MRPLPSTRHVAEVGDHLRAGTESLGEHLELDRSAGVGGAEPQRAVVVGAGGGREAQADGRGLAGPDGQRERVAEDREAARGQVGARERDGREARRVEEARGPVTALADLDAAEVERRA